VEDDSAAIITETTYIIKVERWSDDEIMDDELEIHYYQGEGEAQILTKLTNDQLLGSTIE